MANTANSNTAIKRKAPPKAWKKGQSGNPKGAPKRGESWTEIIKRIGDMTPIEAADHAKAIANKLRVMGDGLTLKEAVVVRVYAALLFEPQASLLNSFMDRAEGKVIEPVDLTSKGKQITEIVMKWNSDDNSDSGSEPAPIAEESTTRAQEA